MINAYIKRHRKANEIDKIEMLISTLILKHNYGVRFNVFNFYRTYRFVISEPNFISTRAPIQIV